jgi:hypothetical protein
MKKITLIVFSIITYTCTAQQKMMTHNGIINFEASIPFFEEVKATNAKVFCVLEPRKNEFNCIVLIKQFQFKRPLMETHFNENYLESSKYARAIFKGKIEKFDLKNIDTIAKEYQIKGKIIVHGQEKKINVKAIIRKTDDGIEIISNFDLNTDDFKIGIPFIVSNKISKIVNTQLKCVLL